MTAATYGLERVDYTDELAAPLSSAPAQPALAWAHAIFDDAPAAVRRFLQTSWRHILRVQLAAPGTPGHVFGWRVADESSDDVTVLATRSSVGIDARLVISAEPDRLVLRTFVQCANRAAAVVWAGVTPVHRLIAQRLVNGAARRAGTR